MTKCHVQYMVQELGCFEVSMRMRVQVLLRIPPPLILDKCILWTPP